MPLSTRVKPHLRLALMTGTLLALLTNLSAADARLNTDVVPRQQEITLTIDANHVEYSGGTEFELDVVNPTDVFNFHAEGIVIDGLVLSRDGQTIPTEVIPGDYNLVDVHTSDVLPPGPAHLRIQFHNTLDTTGTALYQIVDGGEAYTFTQFEPDDAREAFPCWDEPAFKIPFQMTLAVPESHTAVFNTPLESESVAGGWRTMVFTESQPMPTYLIAFATGPLDVVPIPGMSVPGNIVTVKGKTSLAGEAIALTPPILAALEEYFGQSCPYPKLDIIAVPGKFGAMENPGAVTFGDGILLLEPGRASVNQRRALASVMAHELAHLWYGDLVTLTWWDDTWLNEAFASWMGDKITHQVFPGFRMDVAAVRQADGAMTTDARPSTRAIRQPVEATENLNLAFDDLAYSKGQTVLGMFEEWLGPETMRTGVLEYIHSHAWGSATADDFWRALSNVSGKDIAAIMSPYFDQPGVPNVSVELGLDNRVTLSQSRFTNYGSQLDEMSWNIPVALKYADASGVKTQMVMLDQETTTVDLNGREGDVTWIMPNAEGRGYYRWDVGPEMLQRIADSSSDLAVSERVGVLCDLGALLDAGKLSGDEYLRALNHFAGDPAPETVSKLISSLDKVQTAFIAPDNEDKFAVYVRRTLSPALARFGLHYKEGEPEMVTSFRSRLIAWLGDEGKDAEVNAYADSLTALYFEDPSKIDPQLADVVLRLTAIRGDQTFFDECRTRFESTQTPTERDRFLSVLGSFHDSVIVKQALDYALTGEFHGMEFIVLPFIISSIPEYQDYAFRWVMDNYDEIAARAPAEMMSFLTFTAGGCSRERLQTAREFFAQPEHNVPGTNVQLARVADQVTTCADLRDREGPAVERYLKEFVAQGRH